MHLYLRLVILPFVGLVSMAPVHAEQFVATLYPIADIVHSIAGESADVATLLPPGASEHTFDLKPSDLKLISKAKGLFYASKALDAWALPRQKENSLELQSLIPKNKIITRGTTIDPHFWLDPTIMRDLVPGLVDFLCKSSPERCSTYKNNGKILSDKLTELDKNIAATLEHIKNKKLVLTHAFLGYFAKRYGLEIIAEIEPSPGKEPTPKDMQRIIGLMKENKIEALFAEPQLPEKPVQSIAEAVEAKVFILDPLGGVSGRDSYEKLLRYNADTLRDALGR